MASVNAPLLDGSGNKSKDFGVTGTVKDYDAGESAGDALADGNGAVDGDES